MFQATGTQVSDSHRASVRVSRAARDLAHFFHRLPLDRIPWAIPYLPGGLTNQLVISRIVQDTEGPIDPIAARFSLLRRPSAMGRVYPQPDTGARALSSPPAAEGPQDQEASASPGAVVGTALSAETTG